jgi:RNAse (barnase) inhibitor barstar
MIDPSVFSFDVRVLNLDPESDFIAQIPSGLSDQNQLFQTLSRELQFPDYFGNNWDALDECLRDLCWIKSRRVVILHDDLPPLDRKSLSTYLDILSYCVRDWKPNEDHELVVGFPPSVRDTIVDIAKNPSS